MSAATGVDARGGVAVCSRAGCRAEALWQVVWRNPRTVSYTHLTLPTNREV